MMLIARPPSEPRAKHRALSLLPGIAFIGFGALFLAPFLYRAEVLSPEAVARLLAFSLGTAFLLVTLPALAHAITRVGGAWRDGIILARLERLLFAMGHVAVMVTLLGMFGLIVLDMGGGVAGVPVGMGMLIAGLLYACGGVCRVLR